MNYVIPLFATVLAVVPFAIRQPQIYDYYIAAHDGSVFAVPGQYVCVNTRCRRFSRAVTVSKGDYIEIMRGTLEGRLATRTYWFLLFLVSSVLWYASFKQTRARLAEERFELVTGQRREPESQ